MSIVTIGDFKNYLQTVANAVSSGKMNVNDAEVKSVLQTIAAAVGEVSATPTANTLADRLKAIADRLGEASANPAANTALARLKALEGYLDGVEAALGAQADAEATGNGSIIAILKRLRTILNDVWNDTANALNVQLTGSNVILLERFPVTVTAGALAFNVISNLNVKNYKSLSVIITTNSVHPIGVAFVWKKSEATANIVVESAANATIVSGWGYNRNINEVVVHGDLFNINLSNGDTVDRVYTITVVGHVY